MSLILGILAACLSTVLAAAVLWHRRRSLPHWAFSAGMVLFAAESLFIGLSNSAVLPGDVLRWLWLRWMVRAFLPTIWLVFSLTYSRGNYKTYLDRWWPVLVVTSIVPIALTLGFRDALLNPQVKVTTNFGSFIRLGWAGVTLNLVFLISTLLVLMNLELTFRTSVGTMRWRIKYMILGLAILFAARIYVCSQTLLYSGVSLGLANIDSFGLLIGSVLICRSLLRTEIFNVDVYPSQTALYRSVTVLLVGIYLLAVGGLAKLISLMGHAENFPITAFFVFASLALMVVALNSDRVQQGTRLWLSRHFARPLYDYRKVWTEFSEKTSSLIDEKRLCREVAKMVSETFEVLSVTIWLTREESDRLSLGGSTSLSEAKALDLGQASVDLKGLSDVFCSHPNPVDLSKCTEPWVDIVKRCNPDYFLKGGHRVCVPFVSANRLLGLMSLGDRVGGLPFSIEELDVLKCIGDQLAANILNIRLSQKLVQAKELEAFQAISAFFVHDLKNTASSLSLLLRNLSIHFENPAFREDAVKAVSKCVHRINDLIGGLSLFRSKLEPRLQLVDLAEVATASLATLDGSLKRSLIQELAPVPKVPLDSELIQKVIVNLLLNAQEATGPEGEIRLRTSQENGWAVLSVSDTGAGMSPEFIAESLFRPFKTTKKKGIGIGLFHCKMIIEAHRGHIKVDSTPNAGTTFRVFFPLNDAP